MLIKHFHFGGAFLFENNERVRISMNGNEVFKTRDFYLACFLRASGFELIDAMENSDRYIYFSFPKTNETDNLIIRLYSNKKSVNVNQFIDSIRDIRALIHNFRMKSKG